VVDNKYPGRISLNERIFEMVLEDVAKFCEDAANQPINNELVTNFFSIKN
jgi:hypothetical protein